MRDPNTFDGGQPTAYGLLLDFAETAVDLHNIVDVDLQHKHQTWMTLTGADGKEYIVDIQDKATVGKAKRPWNTNAR